MTHTNRAALHTSELLVLDDDSVDWIASAVTDEQTLVAMTGVSRQWKQIADRNSHWYRSVILCCPSLADIRLLRAGEENLMKAGAKAAFMLWYNNDQIRFVCKFTRYGKRKDLLPQSSV